MEFNKSRFKFRGGGQHTVYQLHDKDVLDTLCQMFDVAKGGYYTVDETGERLYSPQHFHGVMSLKQVAAQLGITSERVRQIENKALEKLGHPKYAKILKTFL